MKFCAIPQEWKATKDLESEPQALVVRVRPHKNEAWVGIFAFGYPQNEYAQANGVYSCPEPNTICVVANGDGFIVDTRSPKKWTIIQCTPVVEVLSLPDQGLILFADFCTICAWGLSGLCWRANVAHDGIKIEGANETSIFGRALGPVPGKESVPFSVNLQSGRVQGGNCI